MSGHGHKAGCEGGDCKCMAACSLKGCTLPMPHEHGPSSFTAAGQTAPQGNAWSTGADSDPVFTTFKGPTPFEHIVRIAGAVKAGKTTSYVEAAKELADFILRLPR